MSEADKNRAVGIFGHYGNENLGDESIIAAVIQNLRKESPQIQLYGLSLNPVDTRKRHGIESYPIRYIEDTGGQSPRDRILAAKVPSGTDERLEQSFGMAKIKAKLKRIPILGSTLRGLIMAPSMLKGIYREAGFVRSSFKIVKNIDLLFIAGSNQFLDNYGGAFAFPYTLLKWTALARIAGKKVAFVSVGAGPLDAKLSKIFVKLAIRMSDYCSVRDPGSAEIIKSLGRIRSIPVYPDVAFSLDVQHKSLEDVAQEITRPIVAINPMPVFDHRYWFTGDAEKYTAYIEKFSSITRDLVDRGYDVVLFPTQIMDELVIEDIMEMTLNKHGSDCLARVRPAPCGTLSELLSLIGNADYVVATRFHGVVLSLLMERPILGICYQKKTREALEIYALGEYAFDLETFEPEDILKALGAMMEHKNEIMDTLKGVNAKLGLALRDQYKQVLKLCSTTNKGAENE